eukprot:8421878-Ditylum_brightwellii.AAC.1
MYSDFKLEFTVGAATKDIPYTIGVHQGDNLAPLLLNIFFQAANFAIFPLLSPEFPVVAYVAKAFESEKNSPLRSFYT